MLLDGLAAPLGIGMEGHQPLGFAAVLQPVVHDGVHLRPVVRPAGSTARSSGQKANSSRCSSSVSTPLPRRPSFTNSNRLLEHAGRRARGGDEFHDAQPGRIAFVTRHGRIGRRRVEQRHAVAGRRGPHDLPGRGIPVGNFPTAPRPVRASGRGLRSVVSLFSVNIGSFVF